MQEIKPRLMQVIVICLGIVQFPYRVMAQSSRLASTGVLPDRPSRLPDWHYAGSTVGDLILYVIDNILLPIAGLIAVLFVIIGGYQYMFSGANEDLASRGKSTLTNAIIGLIIIILSYVMVRVVGRTLGAS